MSPVPGWIASWYATLDKVCGSSDIESVQGEQKLDQLALDLRTGWLQYANSVSSRWLKSPPDFQVPTLPSGEEAGVAYDRWLEPASLEARAAEYRPAPPGWFAEHSVFNTGMAAVTTLFAVLRTMFQPAPANPLRLHGLGGYFEVMDIIAANNDALFQTQIMPDQAPLLESIARGGSQIIYIEPVSCRFSLEVIHIERFFEAWMKRPANSPAVLIFDTTLTANRFPISDVL